ncbi:GGDEF domain-containing protein [Chromobacterium sp. IIBBL 290-4]|uniref:GGDEF domain-containing protein n=1 Tax=Chromobacterium sp. IIBBL 290-4 TaxID=2953890 RepID=UPI0020B67DA1|nr:GGDEF domain-containing protein [Chromobacterium sp. IIBBL 290-4]UTH76219.1 GGDEF domain-containing protein [Chromobacterium sp. IIBBL 290-4]
MSDNNDKGIMLKAIMVAAPILLCMGLLPLLSFYIEKMEEDGRAQIVDYIAIAQAAMEVKFDAADLNGWQTGYAFDIIRSVEGASRDDAISRSEFLRSADNFRRDIQTLRGMTLSADQRSQLDSVQKDFNAFMEMDRDIIAMYRSGSPIARDKASKLVMGEEIQIFTHISQNTNALAVSITLDLMKKVAQSNSYGIVARWMMLVMWIIASAMAILLVRLLHKWLGQMRSLMQKLESLAGTDELTQLPNRRTWDLQIEMMLATAKRYGQPVAVALFDLDHFKQFNDTYGHPEGDRLLREASLLIKSRMRQSDLFARFGGEEFVLALMDCDLSQAVARIESLRRNLPDGQTFSVGVTLWMNGERIHNTLARADKALYQAKDGGRDRVVSIAPPAPGEPQA